MPRCPLSAKLRKKPKILCQRCQDAIGPAELRRASGALTRQGITLDVVKGLLPICPRCTGQLLRRGEVVLPPHALLKEKRPLYLFAVLPHVWDDLYTILYQARGDFVCVKWGERFLVATTVPMGDMRPHPAHDVAERIGHAIQARPPGSYPRFVATCAWGGREW
jgi:hypothetical protein